MRLNTANGYWFRWKGTSSTEENEYSGMEWAWNQEILRIELYQRNIQLKFAKVLQPARTSHDKFWQLWFERLYALTHSGFDLAVALDTLQEQAHNATEADVCRHCSLALKRGQQLTEGIARATIALEPSLLQWLRFGEQSGALTQSFANIAGLLSQRVERLQQLKRALLYPVAVLVMAILLFLGLKVFVLPRFASLYHDSDATLPRLTAFILEPSRFISSQSLLSVVLVVIMLALLWALWRPWLRNQLWILHLLNRWPAWQTWWHRPQFIRELEALTRGLQHGMTLHQSLQTVALYSVHRYHRFLWRQCLAALEHGSDIDSIFFALPLRPMERMRLQLGARTGKLELQLNIIVAEHDAQHQQRMGRLLGVIPHAMLVLVSLITGVVMIGLYLPLFQLGLAVA